MDTHALIWAVDESTRLGPAATSCLEDASNDVLLSAASIWELGIKVSLGRLSLSLPYKQWVEQATRDLGVMLLPITVEYVDVQTSLPHHHGDPFDRLLIAQAMVEQIPIVSGDSAFDVYPIQRLW